MSHRYPLGPLARLIDNPLHALDDSGLLCGPWDTVKVSRRNWLRAAKLGLNDDQADRWATAAGFHPLNVWPEWEHWSPPFRFPVGTGDPLRRCPQGHVGHYRVEAKGWVCRECHRARNRAHHAKKAASRLSRSA